MSGGVAVPLVDSIIVPAVGEPEMHPPLLFIHPRQLGAQGPHTSGLSLGDVEATAGI